MTARNVPVVDLSGLWPYALVAVLIGMVGVRWWWRKFDHPRIDRFRHLFTPSSASAGAVGRWGDRANRKSGTASGWDILRRASWFTMLRLAPAVRPSTAKVGLVSRARMGTSEFAVRLARAGLITVWSSLEDVAVVFGGPRTGKSAWLAGRIIDHPGALVVTSTRMDVVDLTRRFRERRGPVYLFNAGGVGGVPSTITFDPLTGCADPVVAAARAADMVSAVSSGGGGDREHWEGQARRVLGVLLHAAALGGRTMAEVQRWVANPEGSAAEVNSLLRRSPVPALITDFEQFVDTNPRTRTSITSSIMPTLAWLSDPVASAAGSAGPLQFDVEQLIDDCATVYLLGREEAYTAPLMSALTGHIAREGRRLAAERGGRLDPPLGLHLDEAANICPVPLASWTSDFGGAGITILAAFQSRTQMVKRWGDEDAGIILNNAASVMLFGGTKDEKDLAVWGKLAGERDERVATRDDHGNVKSTTVRKVPVLSAPQLSNLPRFRVVIFRRGLLPCIGRIRPVWRRWDVRFADGIPGTRIVGWVVGQCDRRQCARMLRELQADAAVHEAAELETAGAPR